MADFLNVPVNVLYLPNPKAREVYYKGELWIELDQSPEEQLWNLLHGLAHIVLHVGDHRWFLKHGYWWTVRKQENQSERFTAYWVAPTVDDIFRLPPEKRAFRMSLDRIYRLRAA